ncbi:MAG: hypothetical protein GKR89_26270 [Candidatus Latescibacteria bacterium]|nr:hypothetical protein [Candidatus Latescibacterota bacterium]
MILWAGSFFFISALPATAVVGDLNRDGRVDMADFFIFVTHFGQEGPPDSAGLSSETVALALPAWQATAYFTEADTAGYTEHTLRIDQDNGQLLFEARGNVVEPIYSVSVWAPPFRDELVGSPWAVSNLSFVVYRQKRYSRGNDVTVLCYQAGQVRPCFSAWEFINYRAAGSVSSSRSHVSFNPRSPEITLFNLFYFSSQVFSDRTPSPPYEQYGGRFEEKATIQTYRWNDIEGTFILLPEESTRTVE